MGDMQGYEEEHIPDCEGRSPLLEELCGALPACACAEEMGLFGVAGSSHRPDSDIQAVPLQEDSQDLQCLWCAVDSVAVDRPVQGIPGDNTGLGGILDSPSNSQGVLVPLGSSDLEGSLLGTKGLLGS